MPRNSRSTAFFPTINARKTKSTQHQPNSSDVAELIQNSREISALHGRVNTLQQELHDRDSAKQATMIAEMAKRIATLETENAALQKRYQTVKTEFTIYKCSRAPSQQPLRRSQSTLPALFNQSQPSMEQSQKPTPESKRSWRNF